MEPCLRCRSVLCRNQTISLQALDDEPNRDGASALAPLILTGARKLEVPRARWEFVGLDRGMLTKPPAES